MVTPRPSCFMKKARICVAAAEKLSAMPWTRCLSGTSSRKIGTTASVRAVDYSGDDQQQGEDAGRKRGREESRTTLTNVSAIPSPYVLPPPSWSLSDLNVTTNDERGETAGAVLTREEVMKLCALAHIELAPEGSGPDGGLDVTAVQKDVGAMLRCMQTMRREDSDDGQYRKGRGEREEEEVVGGQRGGVEEEGPWGGAASWSAPLQEDVVSDGGIQEQVLGAAQQTEDGFFTAPKVV
ncbi:unnamed protein product [Hapterophycus canaliculatus]